jgi:hypothetical protein
MIKMIFWQLEDLSIRDHPGLKYNMRAIKALALVKYK